ncbi:hypothetical protein NL676_000725 [Syzygium grande]|nr:hypothetical protein NL676_000725 [Syzygium grande]
MLTLCAFIQYEDVPGIAASRGQILHPLTFWSLKVSGTKERKSAEAGRAGRQGGVVGESCRPLAEARRPSPARRGSEIDPTVRPRRRNPSDGEVGSLGVMTLRWRGLALPNKRQGDTLPSLVATARSRLAGSGPRWAGRGSPGPDQGPATLADHCAHHRRPFPAVVGWRQQRRGLPRPSLQPF